MGGRIGGLGNGRMNNLISAGQGGPPAMIDFNYPVVFMQLREIGPRDFQAIMATVQIGFIQILN